MNSYIDIKDVKESKMDCNFIECPKCKKEMESLIGMSLRTLEEDIEFGNETRFDLTEAKNNLDGSEVFYPCYDCGYIFPSNRSDMWYKKTVECLICPKCNNKVSKTNENLARIGYLCPTCDEIIEYTNYPHHGISDLKLKVTTDYFHGICPNCKEDNSEEYGMMVLGEQIWVEDNGKVVLPLVCRNCGYRDAVKIRTDSRNAPKILNHD